MTFNQKYKKNCNVKHQFNSETSSSLIVWLVCEGKQRKRIIATMVLLTFAIGEIDDTVFFCIS